MVHLRPFAALFALAWLALATATFAQTAIPDLTGRVVDQVGILHPTTERVLTEKLAGLERKTGAQVAVLTIESLSGEPIEDYAIRVARAWKLGREGRNDGVLFLVVRGDRKTRIEVGYGLEGRLTDALAGRIIRTEVTPHFRRGNYNSGVSNGVAAILDAIDPQALPSPDRYRAPPPQDSWDTDWIGIAFVAVWALIFFGSLLNAFLIRLFGKRIKPGHYRWLGMDAGPMAPDRQARRSGRSGWSGTGGGWSSRGGGGFSGGGGSFGGGGASGSW